MFIVQQLLYVLFPKTLPPSQDVQGRGPGSIKAPQESSAFQQPISTRPLLSISIITMFSQCVAAILAFIFATLTAATPMARGIIVSLYTLILLNLEISHYP